LVYLIYPGGRSPVTSIIATEANNVALLDFIKNRKASQQQSASQASQAPKPETAKQMYTRQASEQQPRDSVDRLPADQKATVDEIKAELAKSMGPNHHEGNKPSPAPAGGAASPEAMLQNMTGQDKTASALSPTSAHTGKTAAQESQSKDVAKDKAPTRPPTLPRQAPSWER
jgi:hypothetical protein